MQQLSKNDKNIQHLSRNDRKHTTANIAYFVLGYLSMNLHHSKCLSLLISDRVYHAD